MKSGSTERKDQSMSSKPPLASKRSMGSKASLPSKRTPPRKRPYKVTKARDDSEHLDMSLKEEAKEPKKRNLPKRPKRVPAEKPKVDKNQSTLLNKDQSAILSGRDPRAGQSMLTSPKDRSGFIKKPRFNLAKRAAQKSERETKHENDVEEDEKEGSVVDKNESVRKLTQKYGIPDETKGDQSSTRKRIRNQFYPNNEGDTMSDMGSVQSQAQSYNPKMARKSSFGRNKNKKKGPQDKSESPPKRLDLDSQTRELPQIDDFDSDYEDDFIPDTEDIKKKAQQSIRESKKPKQEKLIDDYVDSEEEMGDFYKYKGRKVEPKTEHKPKYNDLDEEYEGDTQNKTAQKMKRGESKREKSRGGRRSETRASQSSRTRGKGDSNAPGTSDRNSQGKRKNVTPRYLREYRKRKEQGEKLREENNLNKSLKMGRNQKRPTQKSMSQNKKISQGDLSLGKKPKSVKRPANLDYLNRLAQPKTQAKYVVINEETSSEGEGSPEEPESNYDRLKREREERNLRKNGVDLATLISRESPRNKKDKKKRMKEVKPFRRNVGRTKKITQKVKRIPLKNKKIVAKVEKTEEKSPRDSETHKEATEDEIDPSKPIKPNLFSKIVKKMVGQRNSKTLTMQQFRLIEEGAATQIQKLVRGGMTRKWYREYMKRKKFGVPFSGIEINKDPFLRQFAKLNSDLHLNFIRDEEDKEKNEEDEAMNKALIELRQQMENDESLFVYKTIKNKKPKKIIKGTKVTEINKNLEGEFLRKGLDAYNDFRRINPLLNGEEQIPTEEPQEKPEAEGEGEGDQEKKEEEPKEDSKVPQIKLKDGTDFVEDPETLEYLQKVKFINIRKRREEGKTDQEILDELDDNDGLDDEQKVLKSILKKTVPKSLEEEPDPNKRRHIKASELAQGKRKGNEGALISTNFALRSGIEVPETQEMKERHIKEEKDKEKEREWNEVMAVKGGQDGSELDIGGNIEFKEFQSYSREPIVIYKRISRLMIRWIISAGKVFDRHGYFFIPIKIIGSQLGQRNKVIKSVIYLEMMKFPKSAIVGKDFETIWPFLLYLLNNWIRHQFNVMGLTDSKELEERIIQRKEQKEREILEGKTEEE